MQHDMEQSQTCKPPPTPQPKMEQAQITKAPEPIPLRDITLLINYERMISDPRYKNLKLGGSTRGDPNMSEGVKMLIPNIWEGEAESVTRRSVHLFAPEEGEAKIATKNPPATCELHSFASEGVKALSLADRDLIFHETRGQNGCYNATGMYQDFFALCPKGQEISVQIGNETPVIIDATHRLIFEYTIHDPKHDIRSVMENSGYNNKKLWYTSSGAKSGENHCVMAFLPQPHPFLQLSSYIKGGEIDLSKFLIVDMTRLQYGEASFGTYGETYFLGPFAKYIESMKHICGDLRLRRVIPKTTGRVNEPENQIRVKECARRAWERWENKEKEGWCDYCGRGGELKKCGACKGRKVWYCCGEHQKKGWKLHKMTCEKAPVLGPKNKVALVSGKSWV
ncbi:hypothetical protein VTL71DRAFT_14961 [Oculimacula yallundae]|uniref:MYND-type domain-containing protein n=1 Tax=Oculimacula yallundae TaxID=86028 RepID=A0ABR4CF86_9HELO